MAIYKVIQDVEAEDTLIGPLTLKQCIYAGVAVVAAYACFVSIARGASFMLAFLLPFVAFGAFFAYPWSKQQPTEVWALAKIRFFLKPRKRIWNQSGARELVTITAPKKVERARTNGLSQSEVQSRLKALAATIDTRGWAVKNIGLAAYTQAGYDSSDRLVSASSLPQQVPAFDASTVTDMLDARSNPRAEQLERMMQESASNHRQNIVSQISQQPAAQQTQPSAPASASYWYLNHPLPVGQNSAATGQGISTSPPVPVAIDPTAEDQAFVEHLKQQEQVISTAHSHLKVIKPLSDQSDNADASAAQTAQETVTAPVKPATLELANNDDLSVATIAREAQRLNANGPDEVIVSLH